MRFRPCIDIHNGKVKQIVGGSLKDAGDQAEENYISEQDSTFYAKMYKKDNLRGGHIILLNPAGSEYYEATRKQALAALQAFPGGMQIGGGVTAENAKEYLDAAMKEMGVSNPADIKITLLTTDTDGAKKQAEVLQEQYQKNLGIKVEINQVTYKQRLQMETEKDYDMVVTGWVPDYSDAYSYLELWISDSQYNHSGYANAEYDKLLKDSQTETDAKTRQDMLFQAEKIFLEEDSALVPLQLRRDQYLINPKISNFNVYFVGYDFDLVYADISE